MSIVRQYQLHGYTLPLHSDRNPGGRVSKLDKPEVKEFILANMHDWKFLGREERARRIHQQFPDINLTGESITNWLRKQGASYITMKYKIGDNYTREHRLNL